jgi:hypothetical protein
MKNWRCFCFLAIVLLQPLFLPELRAQGIAISYPGLTGESASLWMASEGCTNNAERRVQVWHAFAI